jgi:hypothetical protein
MPISRSACHTSWNGLAVDVSARLVSRYAWTTASIDVFVDGKPILKTGGVFKIAAKHSERFQEQEGVHSAEISWGKATLQSFPIVLKIDDTQILASRVLVENWWLSLWPLAVLTAFFAWRVLA